MIMAGRARAGESSLTFGLTVLVVALDLAALELAEPDAAPAFTRPPERAEDQLEALLLPPETRNDLGPLAFLLEAKRVSSPSGKAVRSVVSLP